MKGVIMANSLRSKIKKLYHDNNISEKMCNELLEKLEGHDRELRNKAIDEFAERLKEKYGCLGYIDEIKFEEVDGIAAQMKGE
jgi:hypothetical protein